MTDPQPTASTPTINTRLVLVLVGVLVGILLWRSQLSENAPESPDSPLRSAAGPADEPSAEPVRLSREQVTDNGPEPIGQAVEVPWQTGLSVWQATLAAEQVDPSWKSNWRGEGEMAFLQQLGDQENQGATGSNWQFEVNGVYGDRSAGAVTVEPGDHILWRLGPYK